LNPTPHSHFLCDYLLKKRKKKEKRKKKGPYTWYHLTLFRSKMVLNPWLVYSLTVNQTDQEQDGS
jgi:hypothetical protein